MNESRRRHREKILHPACAGSRAPAGARSRANAVGRALGVFAALAAAASVAFAQSRSEELERAHAEVIAAQKALEEARRKREAGVEALPGERLGIKGGGSRLADAYFERQKRLEDEVRVAEERLARAYRRWNELK